MGSAFFFQREHFCDFLENHRRDDESKSNVRHVLLNLVVSITHIAGREQYVLIGFFFDPFLLIKAGQCNLHFEPLVGVFKSNDLGQIGLGDLYNLERTNALVLADSRHARFSFCVVVSIQYEGFRGFNFGTFSIVADVLDLASEPVFCHGIKILSDDQPWVESSRCFDEH